VDLRVAAEFTGVPVAMLMDVRLQGPLQACVLRLADRTSTVDPVEIQLECPGADALDVETAIELRLESGLLVGTADGVKLTRRGRAATH